MRRLTFKTNYKQILADNYAVAYILKFEINFQIVFCWSSDYHANDNSFFYMLQSNRINKSWKRNHFKTFPDNTTEEIGISKETNVQRNPTLHHFNPTTKKILSSSPMDFWLHKLRYSSLFWKQPSINQIPKIFRYILRYYQT
jgi:hypothetical protein